MKILVEYTNTPPPDADGRRSQPAFLSEVVSLKFFHSIKYILRLFFAAQRLGGCEIIEPDQAIRDAADLARDSDYAVVVVGLTHEWESESYDRTTLALPGRQDELIKAVGEANPKTVVVVQSVRRTSTLYLQLPT